MKFLLSAIFSLLTIIPLDSVNAAEEKFNYKSVVAPPILAMGKPKLWKGVGDLNILVSSNVEMAQDHVKQGFALLHAQWDVEAYRHFAAAIELDNDCLMAYCGVVMSVLNPEHEWKAYKARAMNRMLTLCEHKHKDAFDQVVYTYPNNERGYAIAIAELITVSYAKGVESFSKLAKMYPNDVQLALMNPFLNRGKYDVFGQPNTAQEIAVKKIKDIMDQNPGNPLAINFYIMMLIEAPYNAVDQKKEVLPLTRNLVDLSGGELPNWHMLHGYAAWRSGELLEAKKAYEAAVKIYTDWKKQTGANLSECDGLMRAYSFLAIIYNELGDETSVDSVMAKMEKAKYTRKSSTVYSMYDWNHQLLKSKILFGRYAEGTTKTKSIIASAIKELPKINTNTKDREDFNKVIKGYQAYALGLSHFHNGDKAKSMAMASMLGQIIAEVKTLTNKSRSKPYYPHMLMSLKTLMIYHNELAALREEESGVGAMNWYNEAIDLQLGPSRLFPPNILYPLEYKLGRFYESKGDKLKAYESYAKANKRMPSHKASKVASERLKSTALAIKKANADAHVAAIEKAREVRDILKAEQKLLIEEAKMERLKEQNNGE